MNEVDYSWYDDRVEAFVDDELPQNETEAFRQRLEQDKALKGQVEAAFELRTRLRAGSGLRCPPSVKTAVLQQTRPARSWFNQWAIPIAAAATLAIAAIVALPLGKTPSSQELAAARADLELAFAYLDRAGKRAALDVSEQVLREGIIRPVQAGLDHRVPSQVSGGNQSESSS